MKPAAFLIAGLVLLFGVPHLTKLVGKPPAVRPGPATAAVYVYEKNDGTPPVGVTVGLDRLNRERRIVATAFEDDSTDGDGDVPEQYRAALDAARKAGEPALVVLSGSTVIRVVKAPKDADEIVRACE